jgi:hypothetical protein
MTTPIGPVGETRPVRRRRNPALPGSGPDCVGGRWAVARRAWRAWWTGAVWLPLLAVMLFPSTACAQEPKRWAVIVGVSDYQHFEDEIGGDLPGAVNDARAMQQVLTARWGFRPENIRMLLDDGATRENIRVALTQWLPAGMREGDLVVFYFAGHGAQQWDENGDEPDGLDETLAPYDALPQSTANDISDDELGAWLESLPTRDVVVILDNCHSGTGTRSLPRFARPRALKRALDPAARSRALSVSPQATSRGHGRSEASHILELAAAQADQLAMDLFWNGGAGGEGRWGGAFTTMLVRRLWEAPPGATYQEVFHRVHQDVRRLGLAQKPRISGGLSADRPLFVGSAGRAEAVVEESAFEVAAGPDGEHVRIHDPSHRLRAGDLLSTPAGVLEVVGNEPRNGLARWVSGARTAFSTGRAELFARQISSPVLHVALEDAAAALAPALRRAWLNGPGRLRLVSDTSAFADLIVGPVPEGLAVWGRDGSVRHTIRRTPDTAAAAPVLDSILNHEWRARQLAEIHNPTTEFHLLLSSADDMADFMLGAPVGFQVRSDLDGYLTVLDLGTDGTVSVLFPTDRGVDSRIRAGEQIVLPDPTMLVEYIATEPSGQGTVKAFVTPRPLGLSAQGASDFDGTSLLDALRRAIGPVPGGFFGGDALPLSGWATASFTYRILREP